MSYRNEQAEEELEKLGYVCTPYMMLKLVKQYNRLVSMLQYQKQSTEKIHARLRVVRKKNFELRKELQKLKKEAKPT